MMNADDYVNWVVGKPYRVGADGDDEFDCWGLLPHAMRHVYGVVLPTPSQRINNDLDAGAREQIGAGLWQECDASEAHIFCCYDGDKCVHVGLVMCDRALHAAGELTRGQVALWRLNVLRRVYKKVTYYKWSALCR